MRAEFDTQLASVEEKKKRRDEQQDADARRTAANLGQNVDAMLARAWAARQQALKVKAMSEPMVDWDELHAGEAEAAS